MDRQPTAISTTNDTSPSSEGTQHKLVILSKLTESAAPISPSAQAGADRCMRHTNSWTPSIQRRQSWSPEERKHEMHMDKIGQVNTGPGFTERGGA
ncbi:hypothetical protein FLAG1_07615 [Fusarium langsethiae]|uniref:Uncharacterized protein n=1 Tax=Fusarium langsethiae TaxID=179993 RepID=A0A0M9ETF0_FUSLA|nr:hypothetical protein FLAG1_07615 [Fusarium langsethiae]GKU05042.1 unnamed protein product [Fusarium langsethiae]GKU19379.1 unnamed protein product [Fusarium langsethiae]